MKPLYCLAVILALAALLCFASGESPAEGFAPVAENSGLRLYINPENGTLALEDRQTGAIWYSNPPEGSKDKNSKGIPKTNMQSMFVLNMYDSEGLTFVASTLVGSVNKDGFSYEAIDSGARLTFDFPRPSENLVFKVDVTLEDGCMKVEPRLDMLAERDEIYLYSMAVLPYFGAGGLDDEGYLVLPDGCGSVLSYNNGRSVFGDWTKRVYGASLTMSKQFLGELDETVRMPAFGIVNNGNAMLVEMSEGTGTITATQSMRLTSYTTAYFTPDARFFDSASLPGAGGTLRNVTLTIGDALPEQNPVVRYYPVREANVASIADKYRSVLEKRGAFDSARADTGISRMYVTLTGAVTVKKAVMGVPVNTVVSLTQFERAKEMLSELKALGVCDISLIYDGWIDGGLGGEAPAEAEPESKLGDLNVLLEYARGEGIPIYLNADFVNIAQTGNGFSMWDFAKGINKSVAYQYEYRLSTLFPNEDQPPKYVVSADRLSGLASDYAESAKGIEYAYNAAGSLGNSVFYDWKDGRFVFFETVCKQIESSLEKLSEDKPLMLSNPNAYAYGYAESVTDIPLYSSRHKLFDSEIPFMQMVLHGSINYASTPLNRLDDVETALLRAVECGSDLQFSLIYENPSQVKFTPYAAMYSDYAMGRLEGFADMYLRAKDALAACAGARIVDYQKSEDGLVRVLYDNGVAVLVNYSNGDIVSDGVTVKARSFGISEVKR